MPAVGAVEWFEHSKAERLQNYERNNVKLRKNGVEIVSLAVPILSERKLLF